MAISLAMLYRLECWAINKHHVRKVSVPKMDGSKNSGR